MADVATGKTNCVLTYQLNSQVYRARLRCNVYADNYSVNAEESHARRTRAFYPHRRNVGGFSMTFQFINWFEYDAAMHWFMDYADNVLSAKVASAMRVVMPSRGISRLGVPTNGITFGDHTASMVFSPTIQFIGISDPLDVTKKRSTSGASFTDERQGQTSTTWFYPDSQMNQPGALAKYLYDVAAGTDVNATVNATVTGDPGTATNQDPTAPSSGISFVGRKPV